MSEYSESQAPRSFGAKRKAWRDDVMCEREPDVDADFKIVAFLVSAMLHSKTRTTTATPATIARKAGRGFKMKRAKQAIDYYVQKGKIRRTAIADTDRYVLSLVLPDRTAEIFPKALKSFLIDRNDWLTAIMLDTRLTVAHRVAAYGLAAYLDPDTNEISEDCKVLADWSMSGEKTMRRAIEALDDTGWIKAKREPGKSMVITPTTSLSRAPHVSNTSTARQQHVNVGQQRYPS